MTRDGAPDASRLACLAMRCARAAARAVRSTLAAQNRVPLTAHDKGGAGRDLVTGADLAAEAAILRLLGRLRPYDGVESEESGTRDGISGLRWVIDPLDGTVNVVHGRRRYAVSVAVGAPADEPGGIRPSAAAIVRPAQGCWLSVSENRVTVCRHAGHRLERHHVPLHRVTRHHELVSLSAVTPDRALVAFALPSESSVRRAGYALLATIADRVCDLRTTGSTVCDLIDVASGRLDAFLTVTPQPWDVAAGIAAVRAVGGVSDHWSSESGLPLVAAGAPDVVRALRAWTAGPEPALCTPDNVPVAQCRLSGVRPV
jgi:myo-inositol-1(or 4)-monophosphatase